MSCIHMVAGWQRGGGTTWTSRAKAKSGSFYLNACSRHSRANKFLHRMMWGDSKEWRGFLADKCPEAIQEVKEVELAEYAADVLAQEFGDFEENGVTHIFTDDALRAGAVAVIMYAWYQAWHPTRSSYDLDNSTNSQVYIPGKARQKHRDAVKAVWGTVMVKSAGEKVFVTSHGRGWYNGRSQGTDWMNQRGSLYLAENGYSWPKYCGIITAISCSSSIPIRAPG